MKKITKLTGTVGLAAVVALCNLPLFSPQDTLTSTALLHAAQKERYVTTINGIQWSYEKGTGYTADWQAYDVATKIRPVDKNNLPAQVVIPDTIDNMPVNRIGDNAFSGATITEITIPDSIKTIEEAAFANCNNLVKVNLPKKLSTVYKNAFLNCKGVMEVTLENAYDSAFAGCTNLKKVTFEKGTYSTSTSVNSNTFSGCTALEEVNFSSELKQLSIASYAFKDCKALTNPNMGTADVTLGKGAFENCTGLTALTFRGSTLLHESALKNATSLTSLIFEKDARISCGAFFGCTSLKEVTFKGNALSGFSATSDDVFEGCNALSTVTFGGDRAEIDMAKHANVNISYAKTPTQTVVPSITPMPVVETRQITFDGNEGEVYGVMERQTIEKTNGTTYDTLPSATRKGYRFSGWFTDKTGGTKIEPTDTVSGDATLYAHWENVTVSQTSIKKLAKKIARKMTVQFKKVSGAAGYELIYADTRSFSTKEVVNLSASRQTYTTPALTKGATYYVKVRAYKYDSKGNKLYGFYSGVKKIALKK